jgi:predicted permease
VNVDPRNIAMSGAERWVFFKNVLERLRGVPNVVAASASRVTPISGSSWNGIIAVDGFSAKQPDDVQVWMNAVSDGYFRAMGTDLIAGRDFLSSDGPAAPKVAVVTESFARRYYPAGSALGQRFRVQDGKDYSDPYAIVGIVRNTKYASLRERAEPVAFFSLGQDPVGTDLNFELRVGGALSAAIPAARSVLTGMNPRVVLEFATLEGQVNQSLQLPRTLATLSSFFGGLALLLASIGLYGVIAYSVSRRRNEIGIRIALGAGRWRVARMVFGDAGRMIALGVVIGAAVTFGMARLVSAFLYGVNAKDPATLAGAALVLVVVGAFAALLPALRATRLDAVAALRDD